MITQQQFGEKLKTFRTQRDMNQDQLAAVAGITKGTISKWENGKSAPELLSVLKICQHYGVAVEDMLELKKKNEN